VPIAASPLTEPFRGVLLDLDGTLIDSIPAVERSWLRWCREYGVDPERLRGMHGVTAVNVIAEVLPEEQRDEAFRRIEAMEVADVDGIAVLPGALELLGALRDADVPTAIVTSSSAPLAEARLRATGLPNPDTVVTSSDVARGKPWPDPWLLGADRIGIDPSQCLVVEDSVAGLRAARAAGCRGLAAVTSTTAPEELARVADLVVRDLAALEVEARSGLLRVLAGP
jgi:sugar-phosphatase